MITGRALREARVLANIYPFRVAKLAKVSRATLARAESAEGEPSITSAQLAAIRAVLEAAGVEFIAENGGGPGVRLRKELGAHP